MDATHPAAARVKADVAEAGREMDHPPGRAVAALGADDRDGPAAPPLAAHRRFLSYPLASPGAPRSATARRHGAEWPPITTRCATSWRSETVGRREGVMIRSMRALLKQSQPRHGSLGATWA